MKNRLDKEPDNIPQARRSEIEAIDRQKAPPRPGCVVGNRYLTEIAPEMGSVCCTKLLRKDIQCPERQPVNINRTIAASAAQYYYRGSRVSVQIEC